jgi:Transposase, Mutator family
MFRRGCLRALVRMALQEFLEAELTEVLGTEKGERTAGRQGHRSGSLRPDSDHAGWQDRGARSTGPRQRFSTDLLSLSDATRHWNRGMPVEAAFTGLRIRGRTYCPSAPTTLISGECGIKRRRWD